MATKTLPKKSTVQEMRTQGWWARVSISLSSKDKMLFAKHLTVLLGSGVALDDSLQTLLRQSTGSSKKILTVLSESLKSGKTLADGFSQFPNIFSPVFVNLVRAGESSGTLKENLNYLSEHMEKDQEVRKQLISAMVYPIIVLVGAIVVGAGVVLFILPNIAQAFASLNVTLPLTTRMLLWFADFVEAYGIYIPFVMIFFAVAVIVLRRYAAVKRVTHRVLLYIPVLKTFSQVSNLAKLCRLMGTLLQSGVPMSEALRITAPTLRNVHYRGMVELAREQVGQGRNLSDVFGASSWLVPPISMRMIAVGEESGTLEEMFFYLANYYELELSTQTRYASTLFEPTLVVLIGGIVFLLATAIITPMYDILGSV